MTYEQDRELMEAAHAAVNVFFSERSSRVTPAKRWLFCSAYERGWNERNKKVMELQAEMMSISVDYEKEIISLKDKLFNRT